MSLFSSYTFLFHYYEAYTEVKLLLILSVPLRGLSGERERERERERESLHRIWLRRNLRADAKPST